jgi:HK97 family phage major capsid protein
MSEVLNNLTERRNKVWADAKALADRGAEENRPLTGEEERQWDSLNAELDSLDAKRKSILEGETRAKEAGDAMDRLAGKPVENRGEKGAPPMDADKVEAELRNWLNGRSQSRSFEVPPLQRGEYRSLLDSNVPLPTSFAGQLYSYLVDTSSIRQANPTVYSTSSGEPYVIPVSTAEGQAVWTAEGAALTAHDPTFSSVTLGAYKLGKIIQISRELLDDEGFDVTGFLAKSAGRNLGIASDAAYVAGTGTNQPTGFLGAATVAITAATGTNSFATLPTAGVYANGDLFIELFHSVSVPYRPNASWLMNDSTIKLARKVKDTIGQYLWQPGLQAGEPDTLLGKPVYADPNMPSIGVSTSPIAFGDFSGYFIREVAPIRFERSDDYAFGTDLISFRAILRTDGKLGDTNAIKLYSTVAT